MPLMTVGEATQALSSISVQTGANSYLNALEVVGELVEASADTLKLASASLVLEIRTGDVANYEIQDVFGSAKVTLWIPRNAQVVVSAGANVQDMPGIVSNLSLRQSLRGAHAFGWCDCDCDCQYCKCDCECLFCPGFFSGLGGSRGRRSGQFRS